jgi:RNA-splicing ligase RtcB
MASVYTTSVGEATLDEAPDAYKSVDDILAPISETGDVVEIMRPAFNFKAS